MNRLLKTLVFAAALALPVFAQINAGLTATGTEVLNFLNTDSARLVFEDEGYLWYIDYAAASPQIVRLDATAGGIRPVISADGNFLTFATGVVSEDDGSANGKVWVMALPSGSPVQVAAPGYQPRFFQDGTGLYVTYLSRGGTIPYVYDDTSCHFLRQKVGAGGALVGSPVMVTQRGFTGGLSANGRYLATGVQRAKMMDIQNPGVLALVHRIRMHYKSGLVEKDTTLDSIQACNACASPSALYPNTMLYLDFQFTNPGNAYTNLSIPGQNSWAFHNILYIADITARYRRAFRVPAAPAGTGDNSIAATQWDDSEWSNHPYYGTVNVLNERRVCTGSDCSAPRTKMHERLYLVNFRDSSYLRIVNTRDSSRASAVNMQWPFLWARVPSGFTEAQGWLPDSIVAVEQGALRTPVQGLQFTLLGNTVVSNTPLRSVRVYDITGRCVMALNGDSGFRLELVTQGRTPACGAYAVRATSSSGETATRIWAHVR